MKRESPCAPRSLHQSCNTLEIRTVSFPTGGKEGVKHFRMRKKRKGPSESAFQVQKATIRGLVFSFLTTNSAFTIIFLYIISIINISRIFYVSSLAILNRTNYAKVASSLFFVFAFCPLKSVKKPNLRRCSFSNSIALLRLSKEFDNVESALHTYFKRYKHN